MAAPRRILTILPLLLLGGLFVACQQNTQTPSPSNSLSNLEDRESLVANACADTERWSGGGIYRDLDRTKLFSPDGIRASEVLPYQCETPLLSQRAFTLVDSGGETEIALIAEQLMAQVLDCYSQEREGVPFQITDYRVGKQSILDQAGLEAVYIRDLTPLAAEQLQDQIGYFMSEFPLLGTEMWCFTPEFDCAWEGVMEAVGPFPDQSNELFPIRAQGSPEAFQWVLIQSGNQYWLQRHLAFLDFMSAEGQGTGTVHSS